MKLSIKVQLRPTREQESLLLQTAGSARYAYNWAKVTSDDYYRIHGTTIKEGDLRKEFTQLKKQLGNEWMGNIPNDSFKQAIKDYCNARSRFFKGQAKQPSFKKKLNFKDSFYNDVQKMEVERDRVRLSVIGWIDLCEHGRLPSYKYASKDGLLIGDKIYNPRITYNGDRWFLSLSVDVGKSDEPLVKHRKIGIDLGLKDFAIVCTKDRKSKKKIGYKYKVYPTKKEQFKVLSKKKVKLDRKISKRNEEYKQQKLKGGESVSRSKNYYKLLQRRRKLSHKMSNIQKDYIHQITSLLVKAKPEQIVIEDLNVKGMMKNRHLSKWVGFNMFYEFERILGYKCEMSNISLIKADRFYPSTQTCSECGYRRTGKDKLTLSDRQYICPDCGIVKDRDKNASRNLCNYVA
jgi:putative transposase